MKRYCIYCGKKFTSDKEDVLSVTCPHCHKENIKYNNDEEKHDINQHGHASLTKANDMKDNALSFVVIGGILLVISSVFLLLSFKYNAIKERVFTPMSLEFFVACIGGGITLFCLVFGTIRFIISLKRKRYFTKFLHKK